jgi:hypothetical protein
VLLRLLGLHPNIHALRWESQFIVAQDGLIDLMRSGFGWRATRRFRANLRGRWFRRTLNAGRPNAYTAGLCADIREAEREQAIALLRELTARQPRPAPEEIARRFIQALLGAPTLRAGRRRWCEKTPLNVLYADVLARVFPDMKFIHIVRDGRDVVASMLARGFWPIGGATAFPSLAEFGGAVEFTKAVRYWAEVLRLARETAARVPPGQYLQVRLEDVVADPRRTLGRVFEFLGEEPSEEVFGYDLSRSNASRWRTELTVGQVEYFHRHAGHELQRQGYSLDPGRPEAA